MRFVWISALTAALLLVLPLSATSAEKVPAPAPATSPAAGKSIRILLVGDSTVTDKAGWGLGFQELLSDDVECENLALGGRSSKSFRAEGHWDKVMQVKADYILLQFGHNDCPGKGASRETDAATEFRDNMKRYVEEARAAGMKPIIVTSLCRRAFNDDGTLRPTSLAAYVESSRIVAGEVAAPLVDLNASSTKLCEKLGPAKCETISLPPKDGKPDGTHLNPEGSRMMSRLVAEELCGAVPELRPHFRPSGDGK